MDSFRKMGKPVMAVVMVLMAIPMVMHGAQFVMDLAHKF